MPVTLWSVLTRWDFEPSVVIGLLLTLAAFVMLQRRPNLAVSRGRRVSFGIGMLLLAIALLSPLDDMSDRYLLTAHMVQHLLLVLLVAPLLVRALPAAWGERLALHPVLAFVLFNVVFAFSHFPAWYEATLDHESLHVIEHLAYLITGALNWLPVVNPALERRLQYPMQMLYLFLETLPMFLVGALLALNDSVVYPFYLRAPRIIGLAMTALEDQSLAGLIMWVGGSFFYLGALTIVFFKWANREIGLSEPVVEEPWLEQPRLSA
jgi:putative membrane protein